MFEKYIWSYSRSALDHYEFHNEGLAEIPGYEYYGKLAANIRKHGINAFVNLLAELQVWGTPDQVYENLSSTTSGRQRRADRRVQLRRHAAPTRQAQHGAFRRTRAAAVTSTT